MTSDESVDRDDHRAGRVGWALSRVLRLGKIAENNIDYSLQNTARQALYLVCSRIEKYVGKTAVDTIFVRLGDVLTAIVVWAGTRLALSTRAFAGFNLVLVVAWIAAVIAVGREQRRRSEAMERGEAPWDPPRDRTTSVAVEAKALVAS